MNAQDSPNGIELIPETDYEKTVLGRLLDFLMHSDYRITVEPSRTDLPEPKRLPDPRYKRISDDVGPD